MGTRTRRPYRRYRHLPFLFALSGLAVVVGGALLQWSFRGVLVALVVVLGATGALGWMSLQAGSRPPGVGPDEGGSE